MRPDAFESAESSPFTCAESWLNHDCSWSSLPTRESALVPVKASAISSSRSATCFLASSHMLSFFSMSASKTLRSWYSNCAVSISTSKTASASRFS